MLYLFRLYFNFQLLFNIPDIEAASLSFDLREPEDVLFFSCLSKPQFLSRDFLKDENTMIQN